MKLPIRIAIAALLAAAMLLVGSSAAQARCVTVGADSMSQSVCGLP